MTNFIPQFIADRLGEGRKNGTFDAFGLFLDISGFTKMTESLMEHGKAGAETLSKIINAVFDPILGELYAGGAFVTTFAGDAFTALLPLSTAEERGATADRVFTGALRIMKVFSDSPIHKTAWGEFVLEAKIGIAFGHVDWGVLEASGSSGYFFRGSAVDLCAEAEHHCGPGQISWAGDSGIKAGSGTIVRESSTADFTVLKPSFLPGLSVSKAPEPKVVDADLVSRFVPLKSFPLDTPGEFRNIASVFVTFEEGRQPLAAVFEVLSRVSSEHGGYFDLLDFGDKGGVALFLFGAPVSIEASAEHALDFALGLVREIPSLRVGIAEGQCFTGFVGSPLRMTYTALGRVVNLSARLATGAESGQILVPSALLSGKTSVYASQEIGERSFKGFSRPQSIASVLSKVQGSRRFAMKEGVGRSAEKAALTKWLGDLAGTEGSSAFAVYGEAGIGKTQLAADVLSSTALDIEYQIIAYDTVFQKSFNPFIAYFRELLSEAGTREGITRAFAALISETTPQYLVHESERAGAPLLYLAGFPDDDEDFTGLDAQARHDRTLEALVFYFSLLASKKPLVLVVEQANAMDESSREFWGRLLSRDQAASVGVLYLVRGDRSLRLPGLTDNILDLRAISAEEVSELVARDYHARADEGLIAFLERRTNNIPLYVSELLRFLRENGLLLLSEGRASLGDVEHASLPKSLSDLVLSQVDALPEAIKRSLPQLAILGSRFPRGLVNILLPGQAEEILAQGQMHGILALPPDGVVVFQKDILRETVYQLQLDERLRVLHEKAAEAWLVLSPEQDEASPEKAYHYQKAGKLGEAKDYFLRAAEIAREDYLNSEALHYYDEYLSLNSNDSENSEVRLDKARIYELTGDWNAAIAELERGIGLAAISGEEDLYHQFFSLLGQIRFKLGDSESARVYLEKAIRDPRTRSLNPALVQSRIDLARVFILAGRYGDAMQRLLEARDLAVEQKFEHEEALALYYLGVVYRYRSRRAEAIETYQRSLTIFRRLKKGRYVTYPLYDLSLIFQYEGRLDEARTNMEEALAIYTQIGYKSGLGAALLNLGAIEDQKGNFDKAREYFKKSRTITDELGEGLGTAYALFSLGASAYKSEDFAQALSYLEDAHTMIERLDAESYKGYTLSYLASVLAHMSRADEALVRVSEQIAVIEKIGSDVEKGRIYLALAQIAETHQALAPASLHLLQEICGKSGIDKPGALRFYLKAIEVSSPDHYVNTLLPALRRLGTYLIRLGKVGEGKKYLTRALAEAEHSGWEKMSAEIRLELSRNLSPATA